MNSCELSIGVAAFANMLAAKLSDDELMLVASVFTQLGDTLNTISVQRSICSNKND